MYGLPFAADRPRWPLVAIAAIVIVAGLVFLYLWLNARVIVLQRDRATLAWEIRDLELEISSLEAALAEEFSPEALMERVEEWNRAAREWNKTHREQKPLLMPLPPDRIIRLAVTDVEREDH